MKFLTVSVCIFGVFGLTCALGCGTKEQRPHYSTLPGIGEIVSSSNLGPYVCKGLDRSGLDPEVLEAMSRVPRHRFVPEEMSEFAYEDRALPIGSGQTISQPYIVALMTDQSGVSRGAKVLEIGTGSGYQAAVLAEMGAKVWSFEIVPELAKTARETLEALGYGSVTVLEGDGWKGLAEEAPFDAILVAAASPEPPQALIEQLSEHGRLVIPIEEKHRRDGEMLMLIERKGNDLITRRLGGVKFVPLTGSARATVEPVEESNILDKIPISKEPETEEQLFTPKEDRKSK